VVGPEVGPSGKPRPALPATGVEAAAWASAWAGLAMLAVGIPLARKRRRDGEGGTR